MAEATPISAGKSSRELLAEHVEKLLATPAIRIDWDFISAREGHQRTEGNVPAPDQSRSGVTIATGFDIGQHNRSDLERMGLSHALIAKLSPYCGKIREDAVGYLREHPLQISPADASAIDRGAKREATERLVRAYDADSTTKFEALPAQAQTVIASVQFQYGSIKAKRNEFWKLVTTQQWRAAVEKLNNFGDPFGSRRKKEAELLEQIAPAIAE